MAYYLAIDIGGTNIKYGLIDEAENLIESHEMPTEAEKGGPGILGKTKAFSRILPRRKYHPWSLYFVSWDG